jgi:sec-independent protein translocase protein TatA
MARKAESPFDLAALGPKRNRQYTGLQPCPPTEMKQMLNNIGIPGLLLIAVVVLVLFGRGKVSSLMGEVGKGITAFKKGVKEETAELDAKDDSTVDVTPAVAPAVTPKDKTKV